MLSCGPFAVYCSRDTQQVPFLSFYLCCCANIIILTVNLEEWSAVWWGWEDQWAKFSFLQIAALELFSCWVRLCVPVSWRQPQCWQRDCTVTEAHRVPSSVLLSLLWLTVLLGICCPSRSSVSKQSAWLCLHFSFLCILINSLWSQMVWPSKVSSACPLILLLVHQFLFLQKI